MKTYKLIILSVVLTAQLTLIRSQSLASSLYTQDICAGRSFLIQCDNSISPQSIVFEDAFLGIQKSGVSKCGYTPGDCGEELTLRHCGYNNSTCSVTAASSRKIKICNNKVAGYLNIRYYCVPFSYTNNQKTYDICSGGDEITESSGFLTSPGYPTFKAQNTTCIKKIRVPQGKSISIWAVDSNFGARDSLGECSSSYVKISDTAYPSDFCGTERKPFYKKFCSNLIYVSYLATDYDSSFRGFKLYFETYDVPAQSGCPTNTPPYPISTTTIATTPGKLPGQASPIYSLRLCAGDPEVTITAPVYNLVFVESYFYGVPSSLTCESDYDPSHCTTEEPVPCNLKRSCQFKLNNVTSAACGNNQVQYLYITYRFLPTVSTNRFSMCTTTKIDADATSYGVISSKNYPSLDQYADCTLSIMSNDPYKAIKFYITDIAIADADDNEVCSNDVLRVSDGVSADLENCGYTTNQATYSYASCSNKLNIQYQTGSTSSFFYRGFRGYYEIIDRPDSCTSSSLLTTKLSTTKLTTFNANFPVISSVLSTDENGGIQPCVFPFKYNNTMYSKCININQPDYWCSLTSDYDNDKKQGKCDQGLTSNVQFEICSRSSRTFSCPAGYVIYVISAEYSVTTDGSCDYSKKKCSENAQNVVSYANGKNSTPFFASPTILTTCGNSASNLVHIDYRCLPSTVDTFQKYEFSRDNQETTVNTPRGFIQTPNYPVTQNNLNSSFKYLSNDQKYIKIYALNIDLETVASGKECENYYVQVNDEKRLCGIRSTLLIHESCSNTFQVNLKMGVRPYKGVKLFYEVTPVTSITLCPPTQPPTVPTTTSLVTTSPAPKPIWAQNGIASPIQTKNLCLLPETISCPDNYTISIRETMFGISNQKDCFYTPGDCVSYMSINGLDCSGKQSCTIPYRISYLPECGNKISNYIRVRYECLPDFYQKVSMCSTNQFTDSKGLISSPGYPTFTPNQNCETNIITSANKLIKLYIKDLILDTNCSVESLTVSSALLPTQSYCGELDSMFILETCTNSLKLNLITGKDIDDKRGVLLYYEAIDKPTNFVCVNPTTNAPPTTYKPTTTTLMTSTPVRPVYYGFKSPLMSIVGCTNSKISCPQDHVIIVESSVYGVHKTNISYCSTLTDDCQASYSNAAQLCSSYQNCSISFAPNLYTVTECGRSKADYFEVIYRCVPTREAGSPLKPANQLCTENFNLNGKSSSLFQSPNYPIYPTSATICSFNITTEENNKLDVYINTARFQSTASSCTSAKDYLRISDGVDTFSFCANANNAKKLMQSRTNWISVSYATTSSFIIYRGFQIYVEGISTTLTIPPGGTTAKPIYVTNPPYVNGFASKIVHDEICPGSEKSLNCPANYILLVHEEALVDTNGNGCKHDPNGKDCTQPSSLVSNECSNKQNCSLYFPQTEITRCYSKYADLLHYEYQCIPNQLTSKTYTCVDKEIKMVQNGLISSPNYPEYVGGFTADDCALKVTPPPNKGIKFYINHLVLSTNNEGCGNDYLEINDYRFCGNSLAQLGYASSNDNPVVIKYNSLSISELVAQQQDLKGFKIFFETYDLSQVTTEEIKSTTKIPTNVIYIKPSLFSGNLLMYSLIFGIPIVLILLVAVFLIMRKYSLGATSTLTNIKYSKEASDLHSFSNPNANNNLYDNADLRRNENY